MRLDWISDTAQALFGATYVNWADKDFLRGHIHPEDWADVATFCQEAMKMRDARAARCRLLGPTRRMSWVYFLVRAEEGDEMLTGYLTEIAAPPRPDQPDVEALAVKDELFSLIANTMNRQLRAISGYGEMLERHLSIQSDDVGSEYALGMRTGLEQLHTLLHHVRGIAAQRSANTDTLKAALTDLQAAMNTLPR